MQVIQSKSGVYGLWAIRCPRPFREHIGGIARAFNSGACETCKVLEIVPGRFDDAGADYPGLDSAAKELYRRYPGLNAVLIGQGDGFELYTP